MGSEAEADADDNSTPRLPLLLNPVYMQSPQRSGMLTPPLYSSAAVPFRWEEEPGKPRGCITTAVSASPTDQFSPKCLELPPRLFLEANPSPTTVLDGPYMSKSSRFQPSSFRIMRRECYGSFRGINFSPEKGELGDLVLSKQSIIKDRSLWGSWRWGIRRSIKGKRDVGGASYVFPSLSMEDRSEIEYSNEEEEEEELTRKKSLSSRTRSHFWVSYFF